LCHSREKKVPGVIIGRSKQNLDEKKSKQTLDGILLDFLMCGAPAHEQELQLRAFTGYLLVSYNQLDHLMNAITASKNLDGCMTLQ
jgi:hypothetical protein